MEETKSGLGVIWVLFVILVIWAIFGGGFGGCGNGFGWGNRGNCGGFVPEGGCSRVSNCEIEKNEIIDSARTQYLIEQQSAATRAEVVSAKDAITDQANRIYIQGIQTDLFDLKMENQALKGQIYNDAKFTALSQQLSDCCCAFNRRLDGIECNMLTKPNLSGVASTCNGQLIPAPWGNCGTCGGNRNI